MILRHTARQIFLETLDRLDLRTVLRRKLHRTGSLLQLGPHTYDLTHFRQIAIIALGKAAAPMTEGLLPLLHPLPTGCELEGLVVDPTTAPSPDPRLTRYVGTHPLPTQTSLDAAAHALFLLNRCGPGSLVLFLISGGSSAMLERPLDPTFTLEQLRTFYRTLVHSGLTITEMNTLRKHLSAVKGGRLAATAAPATQCTLLVSDVPPATPGVIGSGPSLPDSSTLADCRRILRSRLAHAGIAPALRAWFENPLCSETPRHNDPAFLHASSFTLLSSDDLCAAASEVAHAHGFEAIIDNTCDELHFREAATYLLHRLEALSDSTRPVCLVSAGELAVALNVTPGSGGRNQHFALECARQLATSAALASRAATVLSAGTDGIDGNSPAAGGIVDATTLARAAEHGFDLLAALDRFDAYPLLRSLGDTVELGPSGTNLRDLRLLLTVPAR